MTDDGGISERDAGVSPARGEGILPSHSEPGADGMPASLTGGIRAVVFDLDDTLYAERDYVYSGYRAVGELLRKRLGRGDRFDDWLWQRYQAGQSANAFDDLSRYFQLGLGARQIQELVRAYREHKPDIHAYAGAEQLLSQLREKFPLGLLSDGFLPGQRLKLEAIGLGSCFQQVLFTEELGRESWKPSPAGFEWMQDRLAVPHRCMVYVADNPAKDFVAPNRLGWRTIQILHDDQVHSGKPAAVGGLPQDVVASFPELRHELLERE